MPVPHKNPLIPVKNIVFFNTGNHSIIEGGKEMPDKGTSKKLTQVGGGAAAPSGGGTRPVIDKGKAKTLRLFAILSWIAAIAFEVAAILQLKQAPVNTTTLFILIAVDLVFAVVGSLLWKKANRLDPASEKEKFRFFVQNQLGAIIGILAFLPLVILIFTNKNMDKKQKSMVGVVAVIAMLIAGVMGVDFNPPSVEQYAAETARVEQLNNGMNNVFWTQYGHSYHLFSDCSYINTAKTDEIFSGTVEKAHELKNITDLCDRCAGRAEKDKALEAGAPVE
jgi:hypothetical protein